jgi:4-amino-4-deoxy-L-arabinose transferase-like glycosyltransferase
MYRYLLVALILLTAFTLRFWNVEQNPQGLYYDEIDAGYQARSILQTGKDYRGDLSPFYFSSYLDPRPPIPVYLTVLSTALFSSPELQVRMGLVFLGTINVGLFFWLIYKWSRNFWLGIIGMLVTATNPWWIQFSRYNHEAHTTLFFPLVGIILFLYGLERKKFHYFFLSTIIIALSIFTYRTMSLLTPIVFLSLGIVYFSDIKKILGLKKIIVLLGCFLLITSSMIVSTTYFAKDKPRIAQIAIFVDPATPIQIQREREIDSGDLEDPTIGKNASFLSQIFHNKVDSYLETFFNSYYSAFSSDFLFIKGDKNHRHSMEGQGMVFYTDIILLSFGIYYMFKHRSDPFLKLILIFFFLAAIPSSLTQDGAAHASRMFFYSFPLLFIISCGWYFFYQSVKKIFLGKPLIGLLLGIHLLLFVFYLHEYHIHYQIDSGRWFSSPYKTAIHKIMAIQQNYDHIVMVPHPEPPNLYLLFWGNIPPTDAQLFGENYNETKNDASFLDRFKIADLPTNDLDLARALQPKTLYLVTQKELRADLRGEKKPPPGIDLIDVITYPDKEVAFYLIKKSDRINQ